ncbi:hypothetical protein C4D60_Mb02t22580 [Musa balbisiana]|uniref:Uncharacterized protein n=1 Tax=Musa balbisiana TaxID=52838 RepID=A0A4S8ICN5_MUSBA|nr:hypothetical protein C4D60_Mb02t22580 [Musa balbisiana]
MTDTIAPYQYRFTLSNTSFSGGGDTQRSWRSDPPTCSRDSFSNYLARALSSYLSPDYGRWRLIGDQGLPLVVRSL